jgi:hypothetical protein
MYIVAIGWAYVILMMAITSNSVGKGLAVLFFLGVLPIALFYYVATRLRHHGRSEPAADKESTQPNADDPNSDHQHSR